MAGEQHNQKDRSGQFGENADVVDSRGPFDADGVNQSGKTDQQTAEEDRVPVGLTEQLRPGRDLLQRDLQGERYGREDWDRPGSFLRI